MRRGALILAMVTTACSSLLGLDAYEVTDGPVTGEDGGDGASTIVGGGDGGPLDAGALVDAGALPSGWTFVAYAENAALDQLPACPAGTVRESTLAENPRVRANACSCGTCSTVGGTCARKITNEFGTTSSCPQGDPGLLKDAPLGTCGSDIYPGTLATYQRYSLADPTGTTCAARAVKNVGAYDVDRLVRLCDSPPAIPAPFRSCVANAAGEGVCPEGFGSKHLLAEDFVFDCAETCTCTVTQSKCTGTLTAYADNDCTGLAATDPVDGICRASALAGKPWKSYRVSATVTGTCAAGGTSTPSAPRSQGQRTVCCQ